MKRFTPFAMLLLAFLFSLASTAQPTYSYTVDLNNAANDQLNVELICPPVTTDDIRFYLPRIVPGTYMNSNYGKYVHDLKAFDKDGKALTVRKQGDNTWAISNAKKLYRISYRVEDTWDATIDNRVYPMAGTNFEAGKNFVINTPGVFGYLEGMKDIHFTVKYIRPATFYGATGLKAVQSTSEYDVFTARNADEFYDSPIMYSVPDTTIIKVGDADVLVAVYSPRKMATSKFIAGHLTKLLQGTKNYLKGKLPVDKYAFIFYFNGEQKPFTEAGAWEHSFSSFYSLQETPQQASIDSWIDMAAHEFFHIVTPLTISSREVKQFNFNETNLSKHVWLYEGSTEYSTHHMQVWAGLRTPAQFLQAMEEKIRYSRSYFKDDLSFTELSKESADKWKNEYVNVYLKGALLSACIDLILLKSSGGQYGMRDLKHDLGVKYGKDKFFEDSVLFREIREMTWPEVDTFLRVYVEGGKPVPYEKYFGYAGINYIPSESVELPSVGEISIAPDSAGGLVITTGSLSPYGKTLGFEIGDRLIGFQGQNVDLSNVEEILTKFQKTAKPGEPLVITVQRTDAANKTKEVVLRSVVTLEKKERTHVLKPTPYPTPAQMMVRKAWFNNHALTPPNEADSADVKSVDNVISAMYKVISGPAGERNWTRFRSLFHPDAIMGAVTPERKYVRFTPEQYIASNHPFFLQHSFEEKEMLRIKNEYGGVAQVFTTYEYVAGTTPPEKQRGINSIELVFEKGRWWITYISWDEEAADRTIPPSYLPKARK